MASSEAIDGLLEWRPGPPEAAKASVWAALLWGIRRAGESKALIGYIWLFYFLIVERAGMVMLRRLRSTSLWAEMALGELRDVSPGSIFEFAAPTAADPYTTLLLESIDKPVWRSTPAFFLFNAVLAGGIIAYLHAPRPGPLLAQLGAYCGSYLGRFVRLTLIGAVVFMLFEGLASRLLSSSVSGAWVWFEVAIVQAGALFLAVSVDFARVRTVARDSRSMLLEAARSIRFTARSIIRIVPLFALLTLLRVAVGGAVLLVAIALRGVIAPETHAFLIQQLSVIAAVWVHLAAWGSMLALYEGLTMRRLGKP